MASVRAQPGGTTLEGRMGGMVYYEVDGEPFARAWVRPRDPQSPGQRAQRARTGDASRAWGLLGDARRAAWDLRARETGRRGGGYALFRSRAMKRLRVEPKADLTTFDPPAEPFLGDSVRVTARLGRVDAGAALVFEADRGNGPGVVTEILTQRIAAAHVKREAAKYRSRGFVAFAGAETAAFSVGRGAWACAVRFVLAATGEETGIAELGVVVVG